MMERIIAALNCIMIALHKFVFCDSIKSIPFNPSS